MKIDIISGLIVSIAVWIMATFLKITGALNVSWIYVWLSPLPFMLSLLAAVAITMVGIGAGVIIIGVFSACAKSFRKRINRCRWQKLEGGDK